MKIFTEYDLLCSTWKKLDRLTSEGLRMAIAAIGSRIETNVMSEVDGHPPLNRRSRDQKKSNWSGSVGEWGHLAGRTEFTHLRSLRYTFLRTNSAHLQEVNVQPSQALHPDMSHRVTMAVEAIATVIAAAAREVTAMKEAVGTIMDMICTMAQELHPTAAWPPFLQAQPLAQAIRFMFAT
jgi:hypothetical protein